MTAKTTEGLEPLTLDLKSNRLPTTPIHYPQASASTKTKFPKHEQKLETNCECYSLKKILDCLVNDNQIV